MCKQRQRKFCISVTHLWNRSKFLTLTGVACRLLTSACTLTFWPERWFPHDPASISTVRNFCLSTRAFAESIPKLVELDEKLMSYLNYACTYTRTDKTECVEWCPNCIGLALLSWRTELRMNTSLNAYNSSFIKNLSECKMKMNKNLAKVLHTKPQFCSFGWKGPC